MHKLKNLEAGGNHTCGIDVDDELHCWGHNKYGQTGVPSEVTSMTGRVMILSLGENHTCVNSNFYLFKCWGDNT